MDLPARFWANVDKNGPAWHGTPCWAWKGNLYPDGYGRFHWQGGTYRAHRLAYEALVGAFPPGTVSDHLCRNHACVNPAHIEPVTNAVNCQRGESANAQKTHCPAGHAYTPENTRIETRRNGTRYRRCRACDNKRRIRRRQAKKP